MTLPVPTDLTNVDLAVYRQHHQRYRELWAEAMADDAKQTFALLAAARCADDIPALLTLVEALQWALVSAENDVERLRP